MNKNCIFAYHMGAGDGFTMYAAVMHYQKIYDEVNIFCLHRYRHTFAQLYEPYPNVKVNDPLGTANGTHRILRGGTFGDSLYRSSGRGNNTPTLRYFTVGFRLARTP